jgi:hypothetical protein
LADEIVQVAVGQFSIACVGMLGEVVSGNDAEFAKLDDGTNFGFVQGVAAIPVVKHGTPVPERNLRTGIFVGVFR